MKYEIMGPLRVIDNGVEYFLGARKLETLLAVLLVRVEGIVSHDELIAEIWGNRPPRRAMASLYVYISHLRKFLDRPGSRNNPLITRPSGYLLRIDGDHLDLSSFALLAGQGRADLRADRGESAYAAFESAVALWRGPILGDLKRGPILEGADAWLREVRLECLEKMAEIQLRMGNHRESVGQLYSLIAEDPLREAYYHLLMLALYRSQRTADALKVYQLVRTRLHDELGLEPCRPLQDLHHAILRADDDLDLRAGLYGDRHQYPSGTRPL